MAAKRPTLKVLILILGGLYMAGCSSSAIRAKKEQREKAVQTTHLYCDFVNGENNPTDVEVALNISMAQKCDFEKPYSLSTYKTPSEVQGLVYCCGVVDKNKKEEKAVAKVDTNMSKPEPKMETPKPENKLPELKPGSKTDLRSDFDTPKTGGIKTPELPKTGSSPAAPQQPPVDNGPYPKVPDLDP